MYRMLALFLYPISQNFGNLCLNTHAKWITNILQCCGTTHVLRLNWAPDGRYLVSAHAMNNSGPTAQIVDRTEWKTALDFVGHRKAVTCVVRSLIDVDIQVGDYHSCISFGVFICSLSAFVFISAL